ncbi:hypothetical protein GJA_2074 [Janthinobacterium agaricidamnosum NBRC 102515 = DSM 9628]|uniref:Uncharacterized protein n=1 Tax=Janthinobacterium agaricidamnosum NBRC 102515 = DSM 9628 TaxID=1349767 RepID=W0V1K4_9BURK|nr:hypothetical protein GJA_2074 [Janthinobacterium agaricidamnosum NBRC 102515 = DSM 9628]
MATFAMFYTLQDIHTQFIPCPDILRLKAAREKFSIKN